ncbi:MAG: hypothetical protein DSZ12_06480, partial [Sulfurovum sp.]
DGYYSSSSRCVTLNDTDGDGIINSLDLDSDNDGCADSIEGGGDFTESPLPLPVDENSSSASYGVPTTAGTGQSNGASKDADDTTACDPDPCDANASGNTDTDGDGISDVCDTDDDNDGILDVDEQNCTTPPSGTDSALLGSDYYSNASSNMPIFQGRGSDAGLIDGDTSAQVTYEKMNGPVWDPPKEINITNTMPLKASGFYIANDYGVSGDGLKFADIELYDNNGVLLGTESIEVSSSKYVGTVGFSKTYNNVVSWKILVKEAYTGGGANTDLQISEIGLFGDFSGACFDLDTDGDGIVDSLDLDSDADGCSDGVEASDTNVSNNNITTYNTGIDVNHNGLLDKFEDNATDNINYNSTYNSYALSTALNACADTDGDGIADIDDLDDDNDGILDTDEGLVCADSGVSMDGADGTFESLSNVASDDGYNSNVTGGGWHNGIGTADSWISPMPTKGTGVWAGMADGTPSSPDGGVFVAGWSNGGAGTVKESFYTTLTGLTIGKQYEIEFYQVHAGIEGATAIGQKASWQVSFGSQSQDSNPMAYAGEGNQVWEKETLTFIAKSTSEKLEFAAKTVTAEGTYVLPALDGVVVREVGSCTLNTIDTDNDGILDHLDLDSDGDGCADSIEGGGDFTVSPLPLPVDENSSSTSYGVPTTAGTGQSNGASKDANDSTACNIDPCDANASGNTDTDNDGISDVCDIDDDNDGITDADECAQQIGVANWGVANPQTIAIGDENVTVSQEKGSISTVQQDGFDIVKWKLDAANYKAFEFNFTKPVSNFSTKIFDLDGGEKVKIEVYIGGVPYILNADEISLGTNIKDLGNNEYAANKTNSPSSFTTNEENRININISGPIDKIIIYAKESNNGPRRFGFSNPVFCMDIDTDGDGIIDSLDLDSDGDGCADSIEGGGDFTVSPLPLPVDENSSSTSYGVPTTAGTGQSNGASKDANDSTACQDTPDLRLSKTSNAGSTLSVGQVITYTVTAENNGTAT